MKSIIRIVSAVLTAAVLAGSFPSSAAKKPAAVKACTVQSYNISVKVDDVKHRITGSVKIKLKNLTGKPLERLCLRNYAASILGKKGKSKVYGAKLGGKNIKLTAKKDKSVIYADLSKHRIKNGKTATASVKFKTDIPKKNDRFGYHGKKGHYFINLSYCFPELAAYVDGKWAEYPYFSGGECNFNLMKSYTVKVKAPKYLRVIAVGREKQKGNTTTIKAAQARDMAIVLSDSLKKQTKTVKGVKINYYGHTNKHMKTHNRLMTTAAADALSLYTDSFGKYPYDELDIVSTYSGGMEFSGLVMCGLPDLKTLDEVELFANYESCADTVVHEVAHQWFYNLVGSNPYTEPWLDEGLAEYCEEFLYRFSGCKSLENIRSEDKRRNEDGFTWTYKEFCQFTKAGYEQSKKKYKGKINYPVSAFKEYDDYDDAVYHNGAYFVHCLRTAMGDGKFFRMIRGYCKKYALKEATTAGFVANVYKYDNSEKVKRIIKKFIM